MNNSLKYNTELKKLEFNPFGRRQNRCICEGKYKKAQKESEKIKRIQ